MNKYAISFAIFGHPPVSHWHDSIRSWEWHWHQETIACADLTLTTIAIMSNGFPPTCANFWRHPGWLSRRYDVKFLSEFSRMEYRKIPTEDDQEVTKSRYERMLYKMIVAPAESVIPSRTTTTSGSYDCYTHAHIHANTVVKANK